MTDDLRDVLENHVQRFNRASFIPSDPVSIPHLFSGKEDIEISGLLTALISWGNRTSILNSARRLMDLMHGAPADFVRNATTRDLIPLRGFIHRTLQGEDCDFLVRALQHIYKERGGLESMFTSINKLGAYQAIVDFRCAMLEVDHFPRSEKHLANPATGSAAKRINMFLRWMVRRDDQGVDFGLWSSIDPARLICPLDTHSGRVARGLGLLTRNFNDWRAAEELTATLRTFDPHDPVKYDFALFGMGVAGDSLPL